MLLQILITIGASQILTLAILAMLKKHRTQADYVLSIKLFLMFLIIMDYNYHDELNTFSINMAHAGYLLTYLTVPLFYLYAKIISSGKINFGSWQNASHLIPFLLAGILLGVNFYGQPLGIKEAACAQIHHLKGSWPWWFKLTYYGIFLGLFPYYLFKSFQLLRRHEQRILTQFSYTEDISLPWVRNFFWCVAVIWGGFLAFEVIPYVFFSFDWEIGMKMGFLVMIISVFYIGVYGLRQKIIFFEGTYHLGNSENGNSDLGVEATKYSTSNLTNKKAEEYLEQLNAFMLREKPFLEPKVTIGELATRTNIPVNYLSQIINDKLGQNFFDFINSYRVEEFKQLLITPGKTQYTLLSLAYEAGFNSKSTFNAIFKKFTDLTPSEYARSVKLQSAKA